MTLSVVDVAACIVTSPEGRVLLAERRPGQVAAGFWEVPGGKIEPGEAAEQAAARELLEETGLRAIGLTPFMAYEHAFPTKRIRLHMFRARHWAGTPHGREGQRLAWVDPRAPHVGPVLPSNDRALFVLGLPSSYLAVDPSDFPTSEAFMSSLASALADGARLARVRRLPWAPGQAAVLLARIAGLAARYPGTWILAPNVADTRGASMGRASLAGVHSSAQELRWLTARPAARIWAATCHDQADLARAASLGADFAVLSTVLTDPRLPHVAPHGWDGLRRMVASCPIPVMAEGGLTPESLPQAHAAGAAGIALRMTAHPGQAGQMSERPRVGARVGARVTT